MTQAKTGDTVKVHYTVKFDDGSVFDTSVEKEPLQFTIGAGLVIPGFDEAAIGMTAGESKTTVIPPDKAYGSRMEELVVEVKKGDFPPNINPEIGQRFQISQPDGQTAVVVVIAISESSVTLDGNHPLAGKELTFDIQMVEIT